MSEVSPVGTVENGEDPMEKQEILTQEMPPEPQLQLGGTGAFHEGPGIPANCGDDNYDNNSRSGSNLTQEENAKGESFLLHH